MDDDRFDPPDRLQRLIERWHGAELWLGLALIVGGFVAVGVGWFKAAETPDVRVQLQALISGGLGGLAAVLAGGFLVLAHQTARGFGRLNRQFGRVTDALLQLAEETRTADTPDLRSVWGTDDAAVVRVLASRASYHRPGCDLVTEGNGTRLISLNDARDQGLNPCRVCAVEALT